MGHAPMHRVGALTISFFAGLLMLAGGTAPAHAFSHEELGGSLKQQAGDAAAGTARDAADTATEAAPAAVPSRGGSLTDAAKVGADTAVGDAVKGGNLGSAAKKGGAAGVKEYMGGNAAPTGAAPAADSEAEPAADE